MALKIKSLLAIFSVLALVVGCGGGGSDSSTNTTSSTTTTTNPTPQVTLKTNYGDIVVELNATKAPVTVNNFLQYVNDGFYTTLIFHRVINNFVIQGGGFNASLQASVTRAPIVLESNKGLSNLRGTIAMARTSDPNSATSQFYINVVDNTSLDGTSSTTGYAVFGTVVAGMTVVDLIKAVPTQTSGAFTDVPVTPVIITSATKTK